MSQLAARGHQVENTERMGSGRVEAALVAMSEVLFMGAQDYTRPS